MRWTHAAMAVSLIGVGCASSGGHGLQGPEEAALYANLSGAWVLNIEESADLETAMREAMSRGRPGGGFGRPGGMRGRGGGRGGAGGIGRGGRGGGGRGGARPGGGARGEGQAGERPQALDALRPDSALSIRVEADSVAVAGGPMTTVRLPISDETVVLARRGRTLEAKARWDGPVLVMEQRFEDGPRIVDEIVAYDGRRLVIERKVDLPRGGDLELVLAYDRPTEGGDTSDLGAQPVEDQAEHAS